MQPAVIFEELITLFVMAFALGMDAFSVGLGMGMLRLRLKRIFRIGLVIGLFHVLMPLFGMLIGDYLSEHFGKMAAMVGGILLLLLGAQMIYSSLFGSEETLVAPVGFGLFLFALSVSLDSFSVGLSLGIYGARMLATVMMFGAVSMVLTWTGLLMGRKFQNWLGTYSEILGGCILFVFGLKLLM
ncbi:MAG TPA: manganese efflux pump MntP family protein [Bacillales bacterium]|nr:manganese efflux pump MntP family protein [Bacillales bacterium]